MNAFDRTEVKFMNARKATLVSHPLKRAVTQGSQCPELAGSESALPSRSARELLIPL